MSSDSPPPPPDVWQSKNMDAADAEMFSKIQGFGNQPNYAAQYFTQAQPAFNSVFTQGGYNPTDTNARGGYMANQGQAMGQYGDMALQTGFDPQSALYGRTAHNLEQQTRRALEARGVNDTPYGAGVEGETMANFNMDWADRSLGRQQMGANTAAALYGQGARQIAAGDEMQRGVPSWQAQMLQALQGAGSNTYAFPSDVIQKYMAYMQTGLGGDQNALGRYDAELKQYQMEQQQQQAMWNAIGNLAGSASRIALGGF